jgi:hypothetical protein
MLVQQGSRLTGAAGHWSGSGTINYAYQWYRCDTAGAHCRAIRGATKLGYFQSAKDVGQTLGFAVHATDATGTATAYASIVGPVAAANGMLVAGAQPTVTGTARQGETLQVSNGSWSQPLTAVGYQWQRCNPNGRLCAPIDGATNPTYTAAAADAGHTLLAVVHANAGAVSQDALSTTTAVVS